MGKDNFCHRDKLLLPWKYAVYSAVFVFHFVIRHFLSDNNCRRCFCDWSEDYAATPLGVLLFLCALFADLMLYSVIITSIMYEYCWLEIASLCPSVNEIITLRALTEPFISC